jgi:predicted nucleotidyltransferase
MNLTEAFDELQREVNVPEGADTKARERRDLFRDAFASVDDVVEVIPSGSLARGSQIDPIHDVDLVMVFDPAEHPDWGDPGDSAEQALEYTREIIKERLGTNGGTFAEEVRLATPRNHSVKCWLDDPEKDGAFTVDVMPALRHPDGHLRVPEKLSKDWIETDPELLIRLVREKHTEQFRFVSLVRVLKRWNKDKKAGMKSLVVELLALDHMEQGERPEALYRFFSAAAERIDRQAVEDPAGLCGEVDPDMDTALAKETLDGAASEAWHAVIAQGDGKTDIAACRWRNVFGDIFPEPEGGCALDENDESSGLFTIITGAGTAAPKVKDEPRPIIDAPQG